MNDAQTLAAGQIHARRLIDRNRDGLVRILREERSDSVSGETFRVCRFPDNRLCDQTGACPHCFEVDFADPRTDAEIANIIIAGN